MDTNTTMGIVWYCTDCYFGKPSCPGCFKLVKDICMICAATCKNERCYVCGITFVTNDGIAHNACSVGCPSFGSECPIALNNTPFPFSDVQYHSLKVQEQPSGDQEQSLKVQEQPSGDQVHHCTDYRCSVDDLCPECQCILNGRTIIYCPECTPGIFEAAQTYDSRLSSGSDKSCAAGLVTIIVSDYNASTVHAVCGLRVRNDKCIEQCTTYACDSCISATCYQCGYPSPCSFNNPLLPF